MGLGRAADRPRQPALGARITSSGRATSTRSPPRCWRRATRPRPTRALDFLFDEQQLDDGSFPQNSQVDGDAEVEGAADGPGRPADRARLAARAHRRARLAPHPQGRRLHRREGPESPSRSAGRTRRATRRGRSRPRSPGSCARRRSRAQRRRRARHDLSQARPTRGPRNVQRWTATTNGPYSDAPYYLRLTKDRKPERGDQVRDRRLRALGRRPAPRRRPELPRARPARRQARRTTR